MRLIWDEFVRRESLQLGRSDATSGRAGVLIASSAIATSLNVSVHTNWWATVASILGAAAAVAGVLALMVYTTVKDIDIELAWHKVWSKTESESLFYLITAAQRASEERKRRNGVRAWLVRIGFALLGASVLISTGSVIP